MNRFLTRLTLGVSSAVTTTQRRIVTGRRGAGFFEYALLALIAVALMAIVYTQFRDSIEGLFTTINSDIDSENPTLID
jgi:Flp pilus assembly pilin Flp